MRVLNLGCGEGKITGADNVDINPITKCELVFDIRKPFPLADCAYDKICFFHCLEHIEHKYHFSMFKEIRRVLKDDGTLLIAYPEFSICLENWLKNAGNDRQFWEATIYGRQKYDGDYHFAGIHTPDLIEELAGIGLSVERYDSEPTQPHNTFMILKKSPPLPTYEQVLYEAIYKEK